MGSVPGRPWAGLATGYGFAVVLLPIVTLGVGAGTREAVTTAVAVAVAAATALAFGRFAARPDTAWAGPVLVAVAALLYDVTPEGLATVIIALLVGAGVGRFLVRELAGRLQRPYLDFSALFLMSTRQNDFRIADCGPAAAVACLALREDGSP